MPLLLAEVMDKVAESFIAPLASVPAPAALGVVLGLCLPRARRLGLLVVAWTLGAAWVLADVARSDDIRAHAWSEAGPLGVALDMAPVHLPWLAALSCASGAAGARRALELAARRRAGAGAS